MAQVNTGIVVPLFRKIAEGFQKIFIPSDHIIMSDNKTTLQNVLDNSKQIYAMSICCPPGDMDITGAVDLNLNTLLNDTSQGKLLHSGGSIIIGSGVKTILVSASLLGLYYNNSAGYFWNSIVRYRNGVAYEVAVGLSYALANATPWVGVSIPPVTIDVQEGDIIKLKKLNVEKIAIRGMRNTWLTVQVAQWE